MKPCVFLFVLAICSCSPDFFYKDKNITFEDRQDIVLSSTEASIVEKCNSFAFNILHNLYPVEQNQEIFISPLSLSVALSMLNNGAKEDSFSQIQNALGLQDHSIEDINNTFKMLMPSLENADKSGKFKQANAMWYKESFAINSNFSSALQNYYFATIDNLNFASPSATQTINSWANDNTDGMVPAIIDEADPDWTYVLANALYFKGVWHEKFDSEKTKKEDFNCISGEKRKMEFMRGELPCKYFYDEDLSAALCELPFGNGAFVLNILLPDNDIPFDTFISSLSAEEWGDMEKMLYSCNKYVIIPKLDFNYKGNESIISALRALGVEDVFDPAKANLSGMGTPDTYVSDVIHGTRFRMDEKGAEAAAVTIIGGKLAAAPCEEFFADHPFIFAIREVSTGAILFIGAFRGI